jgi:NAD(P)-dependent dehydrogenase (short-subunit alcohol dehydrogenase family)
VADVTINHEVRLAVGAALSHFGRIDVLHNNVGFASLGGPVELEEEVWDRAIDLNLKSMFLTCKHVLPIMVCQGSGSIVNVSSLASLRWLGTSYISYAAAKAGVNQFSRAIALEYARKGVRCNVVVPGLINTPTVHASLGSQFADPDDLIAKRNAMCPTGRMGDVWDVAYASLFLASGEAKYVTGVLLPVDGGISCQTVAPEDLKQLEG